MKQLNLTANELIYEAEINFTGTVEYGVSMEALTSRRVAIPLTGAQFDQTFQGLLHGPKLRGKISGTDYLTVRADGLFQLHLHAQVTTEDGTDISMSSEGISMQIEGEKLKYKTWLYPYLAWDTTIFDGWVVKFEILL